MKWNKIPFCNNELECTKDGQIRHCIYKKPIKIYTRKDTGYKHFRFLNKTQYVHRCILSAFNYIDGCEQLYVNHKDFNPSNNCLENLEWCDQKYNMQYGRAFGRYAHSAQVAKEIGLKKAKEGKLEFHINITEEQHRKRYEKRSLNYKLNGNHPNKGRTGLKGTNCKLNKEKVERILELNKLGWNMAKISRDIGLKSVTPVRNVIRGLVKYI